MDNFIFSINATLPIFLTMVLGLVFRKIGVFDDAFTNRMNSFVFKFALPALLFEDLWEENFYQAWDGGDAKNSCTAAVRTLNKHTSVRFIFQKR